MRHRSPRPFLDLVKQPSPRALRRGALAASAVVALSGATGVVLTSTQGSVSEGDVPHAQPAPSEAVTPTARISADRTDAPSRAASRTTPPVTQRPRPHQPRPSTSLPVPVPEVSHLPSLPTSSAPEARTTTHAPAPTPSPRRSPSPSRSTTPSPAPSEDRTVPQTTARAVSLVNGVWTAAMGADEAATFECSVDGGAWTSCSPTDTLTLGSPGHHSLAVRATDSSGNTDPTPAQLTVKVTGADLGLD